MAEQLEGRFSELIEHYTKTTKDTKNIKSKTSRTAKGYAEMINKIRKARNIKQIESCANEATKIAYKLGGQMAVMSLMQKDRYIVQQIEFTVNAFNGGRNKLTLEKKLKFLESMMKVPVSARRVHNILIGNIDKHVSIRMGELLKGEIIKRAGKGDSVTVLVDRKHITVKNGKGSFVAPTGKSYWNLNKLLMMEEHTGIKAKEFTVPIALTVDKTKMGLRIRSSRRDMEDNMIKIYNYTYYL